MLTPILKHVYITYPASTLVNSVQTEPNFCATCWRQQYDQGLVTARDEHAVLFTALLEK